LQKISFGVILKIDTFFEFKKAFMQL